MTTNNNNRVPELRFHGFEGEWKETVLSDILRERNEQFPETEEYPLMAFIANVGVAPKGDRYDRGALVKDAKSKKYKRTQLGDFIYSSNNLESGSIGQNNYGNASISPVYSIFEINKKFDSTFMGTLLTKKEFISKMVQYRQGVVYGQWKIHESEFLKLQILAPTLAEQQKIASCLSSLDELIAANQQQADSLKAHKKGLMQQLFPQPGATTPQRRFPGFEGEWEEKKLWNVFTRITRKNAEDNKNVLTISAQYGLVSQTDFFNKSVAAADVTGYYLLEKGDFAYNKSSSSGNPVGVIKPLKMYDKGVVSTLYICFSCNEPDSIPFWEQYFNAGCLDSEIRTIAQEGARNHGLLNVPTTDFFTLKVLVPTLAEQQKIADCLSALDEQISAQQQKVDALKEHKKGLMQQLFPQPTK